MCFTCWSTSQLSCYFFHCCCLQYTMQLLLCHLVLFACSLQVSNSTSVSWPLGCCAICLSLTHCVWVGRGSFKHAVYSQILSSQWGYQMVTLWCNIVANPSTLLHGTQNFPHEQVFFSFFPIVVIVNFEYDYDPHNDDDDDS